MDYIKKYDPATAISNLEDKYPEFMAKVSSNSVASTRLMHDWIYELPQDDKDVNTILDFREAMDRGDRKEKRESAQDRKKVIVRRNDNLSIMTMTRAARKLGISPVTLKNNVVSGWTYRRAGVSVKRLDHYKHDGGF